jgi:hypothetical protein
MVPGEGEEALVALKVLDRRRQMAGQGRKALLQALLAKASSLGRLIGTWGEEVEGALEQRLAAQAEEL